jgi:hypothetical protein
VWLGEAGVEAGGGEEVEEGIEFPGGGGSGRGAEGQVKRGAFLAAELVVGEELDGEGAGEGGEEVGETAHLGGGGVDAGDDGYADDDLHGGGGKTAEVVQEEGVIEAGGLEVGFRVYGLEVVEH